MYRRISIRKVVQQNGKIEKNEEARKDAELLIETRIVCKNYYQLEIYSNYAKQKPPKMAKKKEKKDLKEKFKKTLIAHTL